MTYRAGKDVWMNECKDYEMFKLNVNVCLEFNICCEIEAFTRRKYQKVNVSEIRFWYKIKNVLMRTNKKSNKVTIENMWYDSFIWKLCFRAKQV